MITRERCQELAALHPDLYYCNTTIVNGFLTEIYGYRFATDNDFVLHNSFEIRGITFVQDGIGNWKRFLALTKFFNVNQTEATRFENIKDYDIAMIQEKLDGSLITVAQLPNGDIVAKSKMSFESEQAQMANEFIKNNPTYVSFIEWCFNQGHSPIFEITSHKNQIVIQYNETALTLLQLRDNQGRYFNAEALYKLSLAFGIPTVVQHDGTLEELMGKKEYDEGYEGFVVTFENSTMVKIKLNSYLLLHSVITDLREDSIIALVLDEKLDDIKEVATGEKLEFVNRVEEVAVRKINQLILNFKELRRLYYNEYNENRKEFAIAHSSHPLFGYVMKTINTSFRDVNEVAKNEVRLFISTRILCSLSRSKEWIES